MIFINIIGCWMEERLLVKNSLIKKAVKYHKENIKKASAATLKWQHKNIEKLDQQEKNLQQKKNLYIY